MLLCVRENNFLPLAGLEQAKFEWLHCSARQVANLAVWGSNRYRFKGGVANVFGIKEGSQRIESYTIVILG